MAQNNNQAYAQPTRKQGEGDQEPNQWKTTMCKSLCNEPFMCLAGYLFGPCCVCYQRKKLLEDDLTRYHCCAGIWGEECTAKCDSCTDGHGECCLCLESVICTGCAIHGNRHLVRAEFGLEEECCDRFLQHAACLCYGLACLTGNDMYRKAGDLVWLITIGCMLAQHELQMKTHGYPHSGAVRGIAVAPMLPMMK
jgi:hypothetical protein